MVWCDERARTRKLGRKLAFSLSSVFAGLGRGYARAFPPDAVLRPTVRPSYSCLLSRSDADDAIVGERRHVSGRTSHVLAVEASAADAPSQASRLQLLQLSVRLLCMGFHAF